MNIKNLKCDRFSKMLCRAVHHDNARLVRFLLKSGAHSKVQDSFGNGLLHITAKKENIEIIHTLLKYGCDINSKNCVGDTPLNYAVVFNQRRIVEILLKIGADAKIKNFKGENSLHYAVKCDNYELTRLLLKNSFTTGDDDDADIVCSALYTAIVREHEKIVKLIVGHIKQFNNTYYLNNSLHFSVRLHNQNIIKILLDGGADINMVDNKGFNILHYAVKMKNVDLTKMLVIKGASVNCRNHYTGFTTLHSALVTGNEEIVGLLLEYGANVKAKIHNGDSVLHFAAIENESKNNAKIFSFLLNHKANANEPNNDGTTPFHIILENGNCEIVKLFLEFGSDVTASDYYGRTALYFAAKSAKKETLELILDTQKLSINEHVNPDGATALHVAAKFAKIDCINLLIERGADINFKDNNGDTPIFYIAEWPVRNGIHRNLVQDYEKSGRILLKHGADVNHESLLGENVLELSIEERNTVMINLIVEHLAIMEARQVPISESNKQLLKRYELLTLRYDICRKELMNMKKRKFYGTISFFNILEDNVDVVARYASNIDLVNAFKNNNYLKNYPIYRDLLVDRFSEGLKKQKILKVALSVLINVLRLPNRYNIIYELILPYIRNTDLLKLAGTEKIT